MTLVICGEMKRLSTGRIRVDIVFGYVRSLKSHSKDVTYAGRPCEPSPYYLPRKVHFSFAFFCRVVSVDPGFFVARRNNLPKLDQTRFHKDRGQKKQEFETRCLRSNRRRVVPRLLVPPLFPYGGRLPVPIP